MENLNVIEILKVGLPGLVFLLSVLSFKLLTREQIKPAPSQIMLKSIKHFMYINIFLAIVTGGAPFIEKKFIKPEPNQLASNNTIENKTLMIPVERNEKLGKNEARYCSNASYANRYLLISDANLNHLIQVRANLPIPCNGKEALQIGAWDGFDSKGGKVEALVVVAYPSMKFVVDNEGDTI